MWLMELGGGAPIKKDVDVSAASFSLASAPLLSLYLCAHLCSSSCTPQIDFELGWV